MPSVYTRNTPNACIIARNKCSLVRGIQPLFRRWPSFLCVSPPLRPRPFTLGRFARYSLYARLKKKKRTERDTRSPSHPASVITSVHSERAINYDAPVYFFRFGLSVPIKHERSAGFCNRKNTTCGRRIAYTSTRTNDDPADRMHPECPGTMSRINKAVAFAFARKRRNAAPYRTASHRIAPVSRVNSSYRESAIEAERDQGSNG